MGDKRLGYDNSVVRMCKKDRCKQWHRIWTMLDHDVHKGLKEIVKRGRFQSQQQLVEHILTQYVDGIESRVPDAMPAMRSGVVEVDLRDLEDAAMDDLRDFRSVHGLSGKTRVEIIKSAQDSKWISVV